MYDDHNEEQIATRLKTALDISDLRDPKGQGVEFEVEEDEVNHTDKEGETDNLVCFDKNKIASNICYMSEDEDDIDENNRDNVEYLTELEMLRKKILKVPDSDITPAKDQGVLKQIKRSGIGSTVPEGYMVCIHYNGYTDIGQAPFDSSRLRGKPWKFRVGKGECIPGMELAIMSMKKHELSRFLIQPEYAYRNMGCPPRIPGNTMVIFDIELLYFVEQEGVDDYYSMTPEERSKVSLAQIIEKVVKPQNEEGKEFFMAKKFNLAAKLYGKSIRNLENYHLKDEEEEILWKKELTRVYLNSAMCNWNLCQMGQTIRFCNKVLDMNPQNHKALYYKGLALLSLNEFERAKTVLTKASRLCPNNALITDALKKLAIAIKDDTERQKTMFRKMFSQSSSNSAPGDTKPDASSDEIANTEKTWELCSEEFKQTVHRELKKFKDDPILFEFPFPSHQLTPGEINCILETAVELGLDARQKGTGNSTNYEIFKKPPKTMK